MLEGGSARGRRELSYGQQNVAMMLLEGEKFAAARAEFLAARQTRVELATAGGADFQLRYEIAGLDGWLGVIAERTGDLAEAVQRRSERVRELAALVAADPGTILWQSELGDAQYQLGHALTLIGRKGEAIAALADARARAKTLADQDPQNQRWRVRALTVQLKQAMILLAEGDLKTAAPLVTETRTALQAIVAAEPASPATKALLLTSRRIELQQRWLQGSDEAVAALGPAVELAEALEAASKSDNRLVREVAETYLMAGRVERAQGRAEVATRHWQRALALLEPRLPDSQDWRVLDSAARALALVARADESRALIERLTRLGYQPLEGWADPRPPSLPAALNVSEKPK